MGGSDQWGNIVSGIELVKKERNCQVYGLTSPLITTASGKKMGKTADGAVWLSDEKFSVKDFWHIAERVDIAHTTPCFTMACIVLGIITFMSVEAQSCFVRVDSERTKAATCKHWVTCS